MDRMVKEYEFYWDSDMLGGMAMKIVEAGSHAEALEVLKELFPEDIGADGFYNDPDTGEETWIGW